jgi:hypothetical protein
MQIFKYVLISLLLLIMGCRAGVEVGKTTTPVRAPSELTAHMGNSTVGLVIRAKGLARVYCTGVWVSQDTILTAAHCVEAAAKMNKKIAEINKGENSDSDDDEIVDPIGEPISYVIESEVNGVGEEPSAIHLAKVTVNDSAHDLALVRALPGGLHMHDIAELTNEMPALGEHVYIVGHVRGLWWSYVEGVISAYRKELIGIDKVGPFIQTSSPVYYGNSGGGLFDKYGNLVGICSFMAGAPQTNFFIHADSIRRLLKNNL